MEEFTNHVTRNREHQRQSRARRKTYIADLEKRIRNFENEGVRITTEIQIAARRVTQENRLLRGLLRESGISAAKIDDYLANRGSVSDNGNPNTPDPFYNTQGQSEGPTLSWTEESTNRASVVSVFAPNGQPRKSCAPSKLSPCPSDVEKSKDRETTAHLSESQSLSTAKERPTLSHRSLSEKQTSNTALTPSYFTLADGESDLLSAEDDGASAHEDTSPIDVYDPTITSNSRRGTSFKIPQSSYTASDETSCESAARIIAGMRGREDPEAFWGDLGCFDARKCMVKNVKIFQLADV